MENLSQDILKEIESKCIQDEEPWCNANCPIHIDVRSLCKLVGEGKFTEGRKIFERKSIFPNIITKICNQNCKSQCKRSNLGKAINIRDLEFACMKYGKSSKHRSFFKVNKKEKILILGSSLSGLSAAYELKSKGYIVDIFEKDDLLGKNIYRKYENYIDKEIIEIDLNKLVDLGVNIIPNSIYDKAELKKYKEKYDAIVIDGNIYEERLAFNEITLQHEVDKVFYCPKDESAINCIAIGKRVATSLDRFFQKSSMTNAREKEGIFATKLYTNLQDIKYEEEIRPLNNNYYTEDEAIIEAKRCIDCNCLECVKGCEFLRYYKSNPKKLARETYNNLSIALGNRTSNKMINSCSLCGQCKSICPNEFDFEEVCEWARKHMVETNKMPPSAFEFALDDLEFCNSDEFFTIIKAEKNNYIFFPGCQLGASEPELVKVIYNDLKDKLNNEIGMILGCCGVIGKWSGYIEKFDEVINLINNAIKELGNPTVITACPTCYKVFNSSLENIETKMIYDFIDEDNIISIGNNQIIAIDDPCTVRYDQNLQNKVRNIVKKMGYKIEELNYNKEETTCCGYGGLTCFSNKELKDNIVKSRINQSKLNYLTYCINCRDSFLSQDKQAKHILQLLYNIDGKNKKPNISERRYNRVQLKLDLLDDKNKKNTYDVNLILSEDLRDKLEDRMILYKDIEDSIIHAEKNKSKFFNKLNAHFITYYTKKNVTFWVEYVIEGDKYLVHNAYSHRMNIEVN